MTKNSPSDKNQSVDPAVEDQIEAMMGPPPNSTTPVTPTPEPTPASLATAPEINASAEPDEPPERLLVIPSDDSQAKPIEPSDDYLGPPTAGETIVPTDPDNEEVERLGASAPEAEDKPPESKPTKASKPGLFKKWWHNRWARRLTLFAIFALFIATAAVPNSRYFILNNVGVRGSASLTVLDNSTQLPLKNVEVSLAGQSTKTDENGYAKVEHIKLGSTQLSVQKRGFGNIDKNVVIGWGSNPLGSFQVQPTGSQYAFFLRDWLTGNIITHASASGGGADAQADQKGKILLTVDTSIAQLDSIDVTIKSDGYRDEVVKLDLSSKADRSVRLVTAHKDVFVSNRSGKYDVYSVYIDGKQEKLVLAGTGLERDDIAVVQHPTEPTAALVSSRVNARNSDGFILNTLTLINLDDNTTRAIAQSEQIEIVGWIGRRLIYVQIAAGASASDPQRFQLFSYDYKTSDKKLLSSANSFNDVLMAGDQLYYAPSNSKGKNFTNGLVQSNADGTKTKELLKDEVWNIFRTRFDTLTLAQAKTWYEYKLGDDTPTKLLQSPTNPDNRLYVNSPDNKHSLWVDQRDGKGLLIDYDVNKKSEKTLVSKGGLVDPIKWLTNDILIYRVHNDQETADHVFSLSSGKSAKVTDLYNAGGIDRWYYY